IYTYENYSAKDAETLPSLTIEYTEDGKTKTHDVLLIDPDASDTTPLAIKRNHLYRINLSKAYKLEFNLEVIDWNEEEAFDVKDLPVDLEEIDWQSLNEQLMVYKLFTPYNVKSLNTADKTVEFFDELTNEAEAGSYFSYRSLDQAGFTKNEIMTDAEGNKYRMPTYGELQLLVSPLASAGNCIPLDESVDVTGLRFYPNWSLSENYQNEFSEKVYLKNTLSGNMVVAKEFDPETNPEDGFKGISELRKKDYSAERRYAFKEDNYSIHTTPELSTSSISYRPVYAIRFKGTSEYAAYLYESLPMTDDPNCTDYYVSVKIKALPAEADITIDDVAYNHSFWADGYIQYTFPLVGVNLNGTIKYKDGVMYLLSSTAYNTNYVKAISEDFSSFFLGNLAWNTGVSLRLVRVLDDAAAK
ncbi:MAG: hypothetical protein K2H87_08790, partial [Duncaniella sp.]|nr:hypothetical protein [Duncaniella sp.]